MICLALRVFCPIERQVRQALGCRRSIRGLQSGSNQSLRPTAELILAALSDLRMRSGTATGPPAHGSSWSANASKPSSSTYSTSIRPDPPARHVEELLEVLGRVSGGDLAHHLAGGDVERDGCATARPSPG
ncbi:hypothetical protein OG949_22505 [Streptomyces scopuliridis]|uniref:hypothetical protein n=1 Tax=Streptomyces scopuliridis TaxID=452529 RepID=UPI002DD91481|nr:hypothetical protein [Streptomyces scopuliridis]WSB35348.1 hypothetical protein OG949_22505 [Streptomyces scopuliridis]